MPAEDRFAKPKITIGTRPKLPLPAYVNSWCPETQGGFYAASPVCFADCLRYLAFFHIKKGMYIEAVEHCSRFRTIGAIQDSRTYLKACVETLYTGSMQLIISVALFRTMILKNHDDYI